MYHVDAALCQAVSQVLLSMRSYRLANTSIQYRYIPDNSTISVLRFSIIRHIREIEIYSPLLFEFYSNFRARYAMKDREHVDLPMFSLEDKFRHRLNLHSAITDTYNAEKMDIFRSLHVLEMGYSSRVGNDSVY